MELYCSHSPWYAALSMSSSSFLISLEDRVFIPVRMMVALSIGDGGFGCGWGFRLFGSVFDGMGMIFFVVIACDRIVDFLAFVVCFGFVVLLFCCVWGVGVRLVVFFWVIGWV